MKARRLDKSIAEALVECSAAIKRGPKRNGGNLETKSLMHVWSNRHRYENTDQISSIAMTILTQREIVLYKLPVSSININRGAFRTE